MTRTTIIALAAAALLLAAWAWKRQTPAPEPGAAPSGPGIVAVTMPARLPDKAARGANVFAANCSACHGINGAGVEGAGPPLIHKIYEPAHHGDMAFFLAVENGVRAHHWRFGNMAPVAGVSRAEIGEIVAFVREVQRANGIN